MNKQSIMIKIDNARKEMDALLRAANLQAQRIQGRIDAFEEILSDISKEEDVPKDQAEVTDA